MSKKKIVIASDSFKGSASSKEIGTYISNGIHRRYPDYETTIFSIADGGEGTVEAILDVNDGKVISVEVQGPLGKTVTAKYALIDSGKIAVMEMAEASGLTLISKEEQDVLKASTYGTGEMLLDATKRGVEKIYIGIGGSATNDGGIGMAAALGVRFLDKNGRVVEPLAMNFKKIAHIDLSQKSVLFDQVEVVILSDVTNPLCGENGASAIYGPQKGATPRLIQELDAGLAHLAEVIDQDLSIKVKEIEGAGAAGGLGAGLMVFLQARAERGIESILKLIHIEEAIATADLVITGEGSLDGQSINGKAPVGIAQIAQKYQVPTLAIVGSKSLEMESVFDVGIAGVFDIVNGPMKLEEAIQNTRLLVEAATENIMNFYSVISQAYHQ